MEPAQNRDIASLHPVFRLPFLAWLQEARRSAPHVRVFVTETKRTKDRQAHLFAQGREAPYEDEPIVTYTLDSFHRWGLAADVAMQRDDGSLIWEHASWSWLYRVAPPEPYGLRRLDFEAVHLEHRWAGEAIEEATALGLTQT